MVPATEPGRAAILDELVIVPQAADTGAMGHISNTALPVWFQEGRRAMLARLPHPTGKAVWPLLVKRYEVEMQRQMFPGAPVTIRSHVEKIGNSSVQVAHEAWQHDQLAATGTVVLVNFDEIEQCAHPLSPAERTLLSSLLIDEGDRRD